MVSLFNWKLGTKGLPPGTLVYEGAETAAPVSISVFDYTAEKIHQFDTDQVQEVQGYKDSESVTWINVSGVHDVQIVGEICEHFGIHPLVQEDIVNTSQRAKFESYDGYLYAVVRMLESDDCAEVISSEQVSLVLGDRWVLSFQQHSGDVFDLVRERLRNDQGRIRKMGADYLLYSLLDATIDDYFGVLERLGLRVETAEEDVMEKHASAETLQKIHQIKKDTIFIRKCVWPLREAVAAMEKAESKLITEPTQLFLRDLYDHVIRLIDTVETCRDVVTGVFDMYHSMLSNRMNEVMKVLTIIATIFIPITFVAGIYGMNFETMPETKWAYGYPAALGIMFAVAAGMLVYFKKKDWI